ncbi:MAG: hypothetical protein Ct9H300mP3_01690 [Gammaproteobacteria bacterium]|nr:MAG: hypothetical protein Ct9H300mP3_01690 [Gammaproteobacteria bacterium]
MCKVDKTNSNKFQANAMAPMVGMAKRKLNLDASLAPNPSNSPAVIVIPDLEVPGIKARH